MRSLIFLMCLSGFTATLSAQDIPQADIPAPVLKSFQTQFPTATKADWEMDGELYKVDFEIGKREHDLWIDKSGGIKKHKEDFPKSKLPAAIGEKLKSEFSAYTIDDVDKIEQDEKVFYRVKLKDATGEREIWFNSDGAIQTGVK